MAPGSSPARKPKNRLAGGGYAYAMIRIELRTAGSGDLREELASRIAQAQAREAELQGALAITGLTAQSMLEMAGLRAERDIYARLLFLGCRGP